MQKVLQVAIEDLSLQQTSGRRQSGKNDEELPLKDQILPAASKYQIFYWGDATMARASKSMCQNLVTHTEPLSYHIKIMLRATFNIKLIQSFISTSSERLLTFAITTTFSQINGNLRVNILVFKTGMNSVQLKCKNLGDVYWYYPPPPKCIAVTFSEI